ncbi:MAG: hypothetical protein LBP53_03105 [Candidatus Peribacteria bacterium]|nr:hypothetical protein [Candidatus Peribacteria bacterium]
MQNTKLNVSSERRFGTKEVIALLIIPLTMLLAYALTYTPFVQNQWIGTLWSVGAKLIALAVILRLFGNVFKQDRQTFKQNKLNFVRCLLGF